MDNKLQDAVEYFQQRARLAWALAKGCRDRQAYTAANAWEARAEACEKKAAISIGKKVQDWKGAI